MLRRRKWELINKDDLPKWRGEGRGQLNSVNHKKCVGLTLKFENSETKKICEIKILKYIYECDMKLPEYIVEYDFYGELINYRITCNDLINNCRINNIIPSRNMWEKTEEGWIGTTVTGNKVIKFSFNTEDKETEYKILHSNWHLDKDNYLVCSKLYGEEQGSRKLHRVVLFNCKDVGNKNIADHIDRNTLNNNKNNLRETTKSGNRENCKRKGKHKDLLVGLHFKPTKHGYSWWSEFTYKKQVICTKVRKDREEAELDNLIAQKYLEKLHNKDQFHRIEKLPIKRIKEVTDLIDSKLDKRGWLT